MAKYDYRCALCGGVQEVDKPMGSDWAPTCCGEIMSQIYSAVPVKFNGGGFYSTGELVIVDIKTGAEPKSQSQLGIYAVLVEKTFGVRPSLGSYFIARTGELTTPVNLDRYTEARLGNNVKGFEIAVTNKIFIPSPGFMCGTCPVNSSCYAVGGEQSHLYPEIPIGE